MNNGWIETVMRKRQAQFSTIAVVETFDLKRVLQFINYCSTSNLFKHYYFFDPFEGLYELKIIEGQISYQPVQIQASSSPLMSVISTSSVTQSSIRSLEAALDYMNRVFAEKEEVLFIITHVIKPNDVLTFAVRSWTFDVFDKMYQRGHLVVIFTEKPSAVFDEDTLRYLIYVKVPTSTLEERKEILEMAKDILASKYNLLQKLEDKELRALAETIAGLNLHEVESVAMESCELKGTYDFRFMAEFKSEIVAKSGVLSIEIPKIGFESIGGYEPLKDFVRRRIINVIRDPSKAKYYGLDIPRGILLFGPPGTGKTVFCYAMAYELKLSFLRFDIENVVTSLYGETERAMRRAVDMAESVAPCVMLIDEIDQFGLQRGALMGGDSGTTRRMFGVFLKWLGEKERKTLVVATTNRVEDLDMAMIRAGRFDYIIPMLYPDADARYEILKVHTNVVRKVPLAKDVNLREIAKMTELFSGAELEVIVKKAAGRAFDRNAKKVTMNDFVWAVNDTPIDVDRRKGVQEQYIRLALQYTSSREFVEKLIRGSSLGADRLRAFLKTK